MCFILNNNYNIKILPIDKTLNLRYNRKNLLEGCVNKGRRGTFSIVVDTETDNLGRVIRWVNCLLIDPKVNDFLMIQKIRSQLDFINKFYVIKGNKYFSSKDGILFNKKGDELISCPVSFAKTKYFIPYGVTKIESRAFEGVPTLSKIVVPATVKKFGLFCFAFNPNLEKIEFEPGIKKLDLSSLYGCSSLKYAYVDSYTKNIVISNLKSPNKEKYVGVDFNPNNKCDLSNIAKLLLEKQKGENKNNFEENIRLKRNEYDEDLLRLIDSFKNNDNIISDEDSFGRGS